MPDAPATREPRTAADPWASIGLVTIEITEDRNRNVMWGPTKQSLRSRWTKHNLTPDEYIQELSNFPEVPGMYVSVDTRGRRLAVVDPLGLPEFSELLTEVKAKMLAWLRENVKPHDDFTQESATNNQLKTWLYWMRRLVDGVPITRTNSGARPQGGPVARIVRGALPSMQEIAALPGDVEIEFHNSAATATRSKERADRAREERVAGRA